MPRTLGLAFLLAMLAGCAGVYTDIRKVDDNNYVLTRTKQGFFVVKGTVFQCTPVGQTADLTCREIDTP